MSLALTALALGLMNSQTFAFPSRTYPNWLTKSDWKIPDIDVDVGKLFVVDIPAYDLYKRYEKYQVTELGQVVLPSWIHLDRSTNILYGLPDVSNEGDTFLQVGMVNNNHVGYHVTFMVRIHPARPTTCKHGLSQLKVGVILDSGMNSMTTVDRAGIIYQAANELAEEESSFTLINLDLNDISHHESNNMWNQVRHSEDNQGPYVMLTWAYCCPDIPNAIINDTLIIKVKSLVNKFTSMTYNVISWSFVKDFPTTIELTRFKREVKSFEENRYLIARSAASSVSQEQSVPTESGSGNDIAASTDSPAAASIAARSVAPSSPDIQPSQSQSYGQQYRMDTNSADQLVQSSFDPTLVIEPSASMRQFSLSDDPNCGLPQTSVITITPTLKAFSDDVSATDQAVPSFTLGTSPGTESADASGLSVAVHSVAMVSVGVGNTQTTPDNNGNSEQVSAAPASRGHAESIMVSVI